MDYSKALKLSKAMNRMRRKGWNGKGMFAYFVPPQKYKTQTAVAIAEFGDEVMYNGYFALKTVQGNISVWTPNTLDILAEDWEVAE